MTPFQKHYQKWVDCRRCLLCEGRSRVVIARGKIPCDVLFVGEAPGESENAIGKPFIGPAGKVLDEVIGRALEAAGAEGLRLLLTNLVGCIPRDDDHAKVSEPPDLAIKACAPRLLELVRLAKPKLVVNLGKLPDKWTKTILKTAETDVPRISIVHPAAILHAPLSQRGLMVQRAVVTLTEGIETHVGTLKEEE